MWETMADDTVASHYPQLKPVAFFANYYFCTFVSVHVYDFLSGVLFLHVICRLHGVVGE